jgi:imidazolonepropionase-like amidohydrolase
VARPAPRDAHRRASQGWREDDVGNRRPHPGVLPGFSLHDDLKLLVAAGLTPYEALRTATANAAEFLDRSGEFGTVAAGRRANLLLLDANPLEDVTNAARLAGVMVRGRWLSKDQLRDFLTE